MKYLKSSFFLYFFSRYCYHSCCSIYSDSLTIHYNTCYYNFDNSFKKKIKSPHVRFSSRIKYILSYFLVNILLIFSALDSLQQSSAYQISMSDVKK